MKIALTADPEIPVPPKLYGGIERIVDMLARGLSEHGHEVTLFAHPDSDTAAAVASRPIRWSGRIPVLPANATVMTSPEAIPFDTLAAGML